MKKAASHTVSTKTGKRGAEDANTSWFAINGRTALVVWVVAAAFWGWHHWSPNSETSQTEQDLAALITDARDAVDLHVRLYKALPARVPAPVLEGLVTIKTIDESADPPVYALEAKIGDATKQWQGPSTAQIERWGRY